MIPVRLKMRNFMCYREDVPALEFGGVHLACLSGDNGNGKSAIIDAMTWALWGKARAGSDDDLVYSGQAEMEVEFEFAAKQQTYRIIRKRTRPKKRGGAGQSSLDLFIGGEGGFRAITANTIAQTQREITENILHMDYDTFVNSAYLRQGHADEFTRQAPARRKEVLGTILGLSFYDELEDRAKEQARRREMESSQLESTIRELNEEIARKPVYEAELAEAQGVLSGIDNAVSNKEASLNEMRRKTSDLENRQARHDELAARIIKATRDLQRWDEQYQQHLARIGRYEEIIGRQAIIKAGFEKYTAARRLNDELYEKSQTSRKLENRQAQLEAAIEREIQSLNRDHALAQQKIGELEARERQLPELKERLGRVQAQSRGLADAGQKLKEKEERVQEAQRRLSYLEAEKARLEGEIAEIAEKLDLIASHLETHAEAKCPLCERELTREGLELIAGKYGREKDEKNGSLEKTQADLISTRADLQTQQQGVNQLKAELEEARTRIKSQEEVIRGRISDIEEECVKIGELRDAINEIEERLARRDFAAAEQEALDEIEGELARLDYDPEKHEQARRQMVELEPFEREKAGLEEALQNVEAEKSAAGRAEEAAKALRESLTTDTRQKDELAAALTQLPRFRQELGVIESEYREIVLKRSRAQEAVGSIRARLERCRELETRKKEREKRLQEVAREEGIYRELARAFGKSGIQAQLIETALPEIENEANDLLSRMTDNRMHVRFDTQAETKSGTVRETLAINIADELGTRNYEMFSGGEAFRINFAIRIALSRLLARRAGAPLPTLIIDEGFGTQDTAGLEKLKEAITSIQNDFEKILVITHMDDLKDAFPMRIDIDKTPEGSTITVN